MSWRENMSLREIELRRPILGTGSGSNQGEVVVKYCSLYATLIVIVTSLYPFACAELAVYTTNIVDVTMSCRLYFNLVYFLTKYTCLRSVLAYEVDLRSTA